MFDGEQHGHDLIQHGEQAATMTIHRSRANIEQAWPESPIEDEESKKIIPTAFVEMRERSHKGATELRQCPTIYEDDSSSGDRMYTSVSS